MPARPVKAPLPTPRADITAVMFELAANLPGVKPGKMFGCPALYVGRKLCACVYGDGLAIKLPPEEVSRLLGNPGYSRFEPMGRKMRAWVLICHPEAESYRDEEQLLALSARYVAAATDGT